MPDRENVIKWADKCTSPVHESEDCNECPYHLNHEGCYSCIESLLMDTVALLKEREKAIEELNGFINGFSRDAVPVIRCRECKHSWHDPDTNSLRCGHPFGLDGLPCTDDWFCADGNSRKVGEAK